ncbi:hypothetical protein TIFTF001_043545 [Ficus carica]|uniref:Uncharacterized protein n=1 Tax=Ficus carica TaxID=3494 RepID=A0AA87ZAL6_FICCA|nr:hypothetical protein TIFTF001_043545 [Ficus carica]
MDVSQKWLVHQASCLPHHAYVTLLASPLLTSPRQSLFTKACYPPSTGHSSTITRNHKFIVNSGSYKRFLQGFQALRVLNISRTRIRSLPPLQLSDLQAILQADCFALEELSAVGALSRLQVLGLCATRIRELPKEMENLINLRQANLSRTHFLKKIQAGIISTWTCLKVLDMGLSGYQWRTEEDTEEGQTTLKELECPWKLDPLSIRLIGPPNFDSETYVPWMRRIRRFQFFIGEAGNFFPTRHDKRRVIISWINLPEEWIAWFMMSTTSLVTNSCSRMCTLLPHFTTFSAVGFGSRTSPGGHFGDPVVPNLRILELKNLPSLMSLCTSKQTRPRLEQMNVLDCDDLSKLPLSIGNANTIKALFGI